MSSLASAGELFRELYEAFQQMAKREMALNPAGFEYLPTIAHDDSSVTDRIRGRRSSVDQLTAARDWEARVQSSWGQFASLPCSNLSSHRLTVPAASVMANREAVEQEPL